MRAARPDLHLTGIDWRGDARPAADVRICGDVLRHEFAPASFDAIIAVSMIEWCGTSKYGDPVYPQGDRELLQKAVAWLKPGGWLYFDVPHFPEGCVRPKDRNGIMRVYDDADLARILGDDWVEVTRRTFSGDGHPDGPYVALLVRPN
jgi:SAM-dependent methyltransferase